MRNCLAAGKGLLSGNGRAWFMSWYANPDSVYQVEVISKSSYPPVAPLAYGLRGHLRSKFQRSRYFPGSTVDFCANLLRLRTMSLPHRGTMDVSRIVVRGSARSLARKDRT
jgi:hypothetical protein